MNAQNLGIGTTTPLSLLHAESDVTPYNVTDVIRFANNNGEVLSVAGFSSYANISFLLKGLTERKATIQGVNGGVQGQLAFYTKPDNLGDVIGDHHKLYSGDFTKIDIPLNNLNF